MLRLALVSATLVCLLACERRDPLLERKFRLLTEENARMHEAIDGSAGQSRSKSSVTAENLSALHTENDRLREVLLQRERIQAREKSRAQREAIEHEVAAIRGLPFKTGVDYNVLNRAEIKAVIGGKLSEVYSEGEFKDVSAGLAALGLLPDNYPLREKYVELLSEQVAAFFDQHTHKLFMYEDASLDNSQNCVVLAHELTHALQDQHFGLKRLPLDLKGNDDRAAAASALCEGDATLVMSDYMLKNLSLETLKDNLAGALGQNMSQLTAAPRYLREMLVFPYLRGQEFAAALLGHGGYEAISRAYAQPPSSTTQILHPEKYLAEPREEPVAITFASTIVKGQSPVLDNVVGEMGLRILFAEWLDQQTGERVGAGWRGDRYLVFDGGRALIWKTTWSSAQDAEEFAEAEKKQLEKRHHVSMQSEIPFQWTVATPRGLRLKLNAAHEVLVIDAATNDWADALWATFGG